MINGAKNILSNFIKHGGGAIFFASFFSKLLSFSASIIALKLIDDIKLGLVIYAFTIVSFIIPVSGLGLHQSLIRYGALLKSDIQKNSLFVYVLKNGLIWSFLLAFIIIASSFFFEHILLDSKHYLIILSFIIPTSFVLEIVKVQFRLFHKNVEFARVEITYAIILVFMVFILSYFYDEIGYIIALIGTPLITSILFFKKLNIDFLNQEKLSIINLSLWKYGFFSSLSNVATQLLTAIDILLIGYLLNNAEIVTVYKYIALIPLSLLFLPRVFMTTDFVKITENISDRNYIKNYIKNYSFVFLLISICITLFSLFFSRFILS
jgi:O-antigen/teichoic acid export membrane protein